jgi:hypothetical protein
MSLELGLWIVCGRLAAAWATPYADRTLHSLPAAVLPVCTQIEGRGNGIKTNIVNNVDIAKALARPPECEWGSRLLGAGTLPYRHAAVIPRGHRLSPALGHVT